MDVYKQMFAWRVPGQTLLIPMKGCTLKRAGFVTLLVVFLSMPIISLASAAPQSGLTPTPPPDLRSWNSHNCGQGAEQCSMAVTLDDGIVVVLDTSACGWPTTEQQLLLEGWVQGKVESTDYNISGDLETVYVLTFTGQGYTAIGHDSVGVYVTNITVNHGDGTVDYSSHIEVGGIDFLIVQDRDITVTGQETPVYHTRIDRNSCRQAVG